MRNHCSRLDLGLNEASFTTLVTQKIALPSPILQGVGPILFDMLSYTSSLPFLSTTAPIHLNLDALILGIAILTPGLNPLSKGDESSNYVVSRRRTEQDARRIVFQALMSKTSHPHLKPEMPLAAPSNFLSTSVPRIRKLLTFSTPLWPLNPNRLHTPPTLRDASLKV